MKRTLPRRNQPRLLLSLIALLGMGLWSGCAHTQLRYQTVKQANTLNDIYEKQVLDNLAMFTVNPQAVPFFAYPNEGGTQVAGGGTLKGDAPLNPFFTKLGFEFNRAMQDSWTLTPVADPRKLRLMRCAYQRAIGVPLNDCDECCDHEKDFLGKPDLWIPVIDSQGNRLKDPKTNDWYIDPETGKYAVDDQNKVATDPATGRPKIYIREAQYECESDCAIHSGWLCYSNHHHHVPKDCCAKVGHYCGTYVWVHPDMQDQFARLVMTILDYAVNDPAEALTPTKKLTMYIGKNGEPTTESMAYGTVEAIVAIDEPVQSVFAQRVTENAIKSKTADQSLPSIRPPAPIVIPRSPTNTGDSINSLRLRQRQNTLAPMRPFGARP